MSTTTYKTVSFGPGKADLATVGYTLTGGSRVTAGVAAIGTGTGAYGAAVTHADALAGAILWDTGQGAATVYAVDEINPNELGPAGVDAIMVEANINLRQASALDLAASAGKSAGLDTGSVVYYAAGLAGTTTPRVAATASAGNRTATTLTPPA